MATISITAEASPRLRRRLPNGLAADARPRGKGGYLIVLRHDILGSSENSARPGESYSDVIIRVARGVIDLRPKPSEIVFCHRGADCTLSCV
jgi:broad specificity phosphatase PhoE